MTDLVTYGRPAARYAPAAEEAPRIGGYAFAGTVLIGLFVVGFGIWAAIAPLASAAVATGTVKVETNRKTVQHLDGGVISAILVRDGDTVKAGQVLVRMDNLDAGADRDALTNQYLSAVALEARLVAQRDNQPFIPFPAELIASTDSTIGQVVLGQEQIFRDQRDLRDAQTQVWQQRMEQYAAQLPIVRSQIASAQRRHDLLAQQLATQQTLLGKKLALKSTVLDLEQQLAGADSDIAGATNSAAALASQIDEAKLQIAAIRRQFAETVSSDLRDAQVKRTALQQQLAKADAKFGRHDIVAPEDGVVMNSKYFAPGEVVPPGGAILDVVPQQEALTVEARIQPLDIDSVRADLPAKLRLVAFKQRTTPVLDGKVVSVSPDAKLDDRTGQPYYLATIDIDRKELAELPGVKLYPGMPVDVTVVTGERTLLEYLVQPLVDSFSHAFVEE
jgi:HlyD family secretion protein/epimerase transport system membrane fusion protein